MSLIICPPKLIQVTVAGGGDISYSIDIPDEQIHQLSCLSPNKETGVMGLSVVLSNLHFIIHILE